MGLAGQWWFWALAATALVPLALLARRWPGILLRARRWALSRRLLSLAPGQTLSGPSGARDPSWLALPIALWVGAGPWVWGYDDSGEAVTSALVSGAAVLLIAIPGIVFPALWALELMVASWLLVAPWLVGYGNDGGPVGLSDTASGLLLSAVAIATLSGAERRVRAGGGGIGRLPPGNR